MFNFLILVQRELANQTFEVIREFTTQLERDSKQIVTCLQFHLLSFCHLPVFALDFPALCTLLCIGGVAMKDQIDRLRRYGCHNTSVGTMTLALYCLQGSAYCRGNSRETDGPPEQKVYEPRSL